MECTTTNTPARPGGSYTQDCIEDGELYLASAGVYVEVFCAFVEAQGGSKEVSATTVESTYQDLCDSLADARRLRDTTGNREPEMAEAIEALEFIHDEFRDGFNLR